ncbi:MAG: hypothetical protein MI923_03280, partial [Phycisphaerales bacterium]|nr:hypothetical protein [Phycisphaerales bacterium]
MRERIPVHPPPDDRIIESRPVVVEHEIANRCGRCRVEGHVRPALEHERVVHVAERPCHRQIERVGVVPRRTFGVVQR